jgi:HEAT repeat protein
MRRGLAIRVFFGETPRRMSRRLLVLAPLLLLPVLARAQAINPTDNTNNRGTNQLRDRFNSATKPQAKAKLDEALSNFNSSDQQSRLDGVSQLGNVEDEPKAIGYLLQAANDPDMAIRLKAIDVLGQARAKDAVAPLVQQLFMRDTDEVTKQHILVALGKIGDSKATKPIIDFLARDGDRRVRGNAIFALGDIGDQTALDTLQRIVDDGRDPTLRTVAQVAMRKIRDRPPPEVVPSALAQERRRAAAAAGKPDDDTP